MNEGQAIIQQVETEFTDLYSEASAFAIASLMAIFSLFAVAAVVNHLIGSIRK